VASEYTIDGDVAGPFHLGERRREKFILSRYSSIQLLDFALNRLMMQINKIKSVSQSKIQFIIRWKRSV
jgi:hypothetical protein